MVFVGKILENQEIYKYFASKLLHFPCDLYIMCIDTSNVGSLSSRVI